jgi:hypothetical protein
MPVPTPSNNEDMDNFMDRCMSDNNMQDEFPDRTQRVAVCTRSWDEKQKEYINDANTQLNKAKNGLTRNKK